MPVSTHGALLGGRYRVERPLGMGAMAHVLLCRDERLGRHVAVKRLHAHSPEEVETRFAREAKLGALLNHPNLVSVFDTVADEEGVLIVMEYVEGEALSRVLRRGPLEPRRVARMARELGAALDHAHGHGVIHRDVKPGNVLLREDGVTKLADLGIATAVDLTRITHRGDVLGTAAYMAPEQLEGGDVRPESDVYALAAVCYEAVAGRRPRRGRTALEIAHRIATEPPPDLRDQMPSATPAAAEALERGMARDPDERPASAGEFAAEFADALEDAGFPGDLPSSDHRLPPALPLRRNGPRAAARASTPVATESMAATPPPALERERPARGAPGTPPPAGPPLRPARRGNGPGRSGRRPALAALLALVALALAVAAVVVLSTDGDGGQADPPRADRQEQSARQQARPRREAARRKQRRQREQPARPAPAKEPQQAEPAPEAAPEQPAATIDPVRGAQLNDQGFALMQRGDYGAAVPTLQQAVASWPADSDDLSYAYALFNLGKSLNRAGRPAEAIRYLEKRLTWDNQRPTVQAELDLARRNAGQG